MLRGRYLFLLSHICHVAPTDVDRLRVSDFIALLAGIDSYLEARKKAGGDAY